MSLAHKISAFNRARKWKLFLKEFSPSQGLRVLDIGFAEIEYSATDNFIEKHYPFPEMITALGIVSPVTFNERYPMIKAIKYGGDIFPFKDKTFDLAWSNAVLEHVGNKDKQLSFLKEIKRVSKKAFITTPNRFFPIEIHTRTPLLHYLPNKLFDKYLMLIGKKWATNGYLHHLLSLYQIKTLLVEAGISKYKIIKNKLFGFTLDFVIIIE